MVKKGEKLMAYNIDTVGFEKENSSVPDCMLMCMHRCTVLLYVYSRRISGRKVVSELLQRKVSRFVLIKHSLYDVYLECGGTYHPYSGAKRTPRNPGE